MREIRSTARGGALVKWTREVILVFAEEIALPSTPNTTLRYPLFAAGYTDFSSSPCGMSDSPPQAKHLTIRPHSLKS